MDNTPPFESQVQASDEELWTAFVRGDDSALDALVERYGDGLYWYLLLSTGKQDAAVQHLRNVWAALAAWRRPFEGFAGFRAWLYAVATQTCVPATHPEPFGLTDLIDDVKRGQQTSRRSKLFFAVKDMARAVRQPFLLVLVAGLTLEEAAAACNFTVGRTLSSLQKAFHRLARTDAFSGAQPGNEM